MEAEVISSERIDHLGIVAGAFKELDLVAFIDKSKASRQGAAGY